MRIALIGGGVMGEAMLSGLLEQGTVPADLQVGDASEVRCQLLRERYHVEASPDNQAAVRDAAMVILAIKPQSLAEALGDLRGHLRADQLVLSIVAGASLATLSRGLEHEAVVRVMPNTPAQVGQGMSVWTATPSVSEGQREAARRILSVLGKERYVGDERYLDMATAVSGSGPAYFFLALEALIDAGVHIGLPRELAQEMVLQTALGSAEMALKTGKHPAVLRNMVTSPGGTTAEGLLRLEEGGLRGLITEAVIAAYEKALILGGEDR